MLHVPTSAFPRFEPQSEPFSLAKLKVSLRAAVGQDAYVHWFRRLEVEDIGVMEGRFSVPTRFLKSWIEKRYTEPLLACVREQCSHVKKVCVVVRSVECGFSHKKKSVVFVPSKPRTDPNLVSAQQLVHSQLPEKLKMEDVQQVVGIYFGMNKQRMLQYAQSRRPQYVWSRQVSMYFCRTLVQRSYQEIARQHGIEDHTTVIHAIKKVENLIVAEPGIAAEMVYLRQKILD